MATTVAKTNPFATAKKAAPEKKSGAKEKEVIILNEKEFPGAGAALALVRKNALAITDLEAEAKDSKNQCYDFGLKVWFDRYQKQGSKPDTFQIAGENGATMTFLVTDRYPVLKSEADALAIREQFGDSAAYINTTYKVNQGLLLKYLVPLYNSILAAKDISKEDKKNLLQVSFNPEILERNMEAVAECINSMGCGIEDESEPIVEESGKEYGIAKGSIDRIMNQPVEKRWEFLFTLQPTTQLRLK